MLARKITRANLHLLERKDEREAKSSCLRQLASSYLAVAMKNKKMNLTVF